MSTAPRRRVSTGRPVGTKSVDPAIAKALGHAVFKLRTAAGMSQESLALSAGIGRPNMSAIENGRVTPNFAGVVKIARALGCSLTTLVREFERANSRAQADDEAAP